MKKSVLTLFIPLFLFSVFIQAQENTISGTVIDETGNPVVGASVVVKEDTSRGASTDFDGKFSIQASSNETLTVSSIGFLSTEVLLGNESELTITLTEDLNQLDEVVVVAYGTQKKETITSSVVSVKSEDLTDLTTPDVSSMLQGKAAGVQVSASSGAPGSSPSILIRGIASLNGNIRPLWVVDGVIQHSTPIVNPTDVANISILKDASATALYGSRGANGVIVVTTKRAKVGVKPQIRISSRLGINQFNDGNFDVMNSQQLYDYHTAFGNTQPWYSPDLLERDTDWVDLGTRDDAMVRDLNGTFTAAKEDHNLFLNLGYYSEEGTLEGNEFERLTFRTNYDYNFSDKFIIKPKLSFSIDDRDKVNEAPLYDTYLNLPWDLPYDEDGNVVNAETSQDWLGRDANNYLYDQQWNYSSSTTFNMSFNFDFEWKILPYLSWLSTNNFTLYDYRSKTYTDPRSNAGLAVSGRLEDFNAKRRTRLTTQILKYTKTFNESQVLNVLAGYEYNDYDYEHFGASGTGIIAGSEILDVASESGEVYGFKNDYALQSFFLAADYDIDGKYFAKGSLRRDGASYFGPDNRYGNFFSLGLGWNIHREDFFNSEIFNQLKLRVSYGSVGNTPSSLYPYQGTYRVNTQYSGIPGAILNQYGNSDLGWEKSYEANIAVDTRILDRVSLTLEYYNKDTSDLLYFVALPDLTGFSGFWENVGALKNTGFEAALNWDIIQKEDFSWNFGFNIGVNKNEITELYDNQEEIPVGGKIFKVGEDANTWYIRKWLGVDSENGLPVWEVVDPDTGERTETNDWNEATLQAESGNSSPNFVGGFNTSLAYKDFSLSANFSFSEGAMIYNQARELFDSDGFYSTFNQMVLADGWSRWQQPGDNATHPQPIEGGNNNSNKRSSRYLEDASYLRLNNVTLNYSLPQNTVQKLGIDNINVFLSGDNLFTITDYSGSDPAVTGNPDDFNPGLGGSPNFPYPVPRRFVLGLNVTF